MGRRDRSGSQESKIVYTNEEAPRPVECDRCNAGGILPYWQIVDGQVEERRGRCSCVNGLRYVSLPHIDHIQGVPKGLNAAQMSAILNAMIAHPDLTPLEACGFIPKSRAELHAALQKISPKVAREMSSRFCPDAALMASWKQIQAALIAEYQDEAAAEMPF